MVTTDDELVRRARARLVVVAIGLVTVGSFGYLGFRVVAGGGVAAGSVGLGAATGFAAFFSPCSFPLLLTFLTKRSGESHGESIASAARVALGVAVLLTIVAAGALIVGEALATVIAFDKPAGRVFRGLVGAMLVVLGLHQAHLLRTRFKMFDRIASATAAVLAPRSRHRWVSDVTYGFGYLLAGFGCTGALLVGLATQSVTVGAATTLWSFTAAIGVFALLIATASIGVSVAAGDSLRAGRMAGSSVRRWSGYMLITLGGWFFLLAALPSPLL